ncbi:Hypothetical protein CINCED_3A021681 [Cinara cedri]|uniref:Uncharacterized protein n=1 Tax=Cinara cedri TaxID=506608 RepID=A0A5E4NEG9_9HEMI|nr:Hypothetical protein CINCED_3A021681 [Cinara cedri]
MSDSLSLNKSVSVVTANSVEVNDLQLDVNQKESSFSAVEIISKSIEQPLSLSENITNVIINNETAAMDLKLSMKKPVRRKYPFTEKSKREKETIIRTQREEKYEQIKKMNEMITHGAEVIKVRASRIFCSAINQYTQLNQN